MIEVSEYSDLGGSNATSAEKDGIITILESESDASRVFRADGWLWEDKGLETNPRHDTLVSGRVVATTEKAYLVTQLGENYEDEQIDASQPQTDWVPKSVVEVYTASSDGIETTGPQAFLEDYSR